MIDLVVILLGTFMLWLWCRRDERSVRQMENREDQLARQTDDTLRALRADVDKLIAIEAAKLPPGELDKLIESEIAMLPPEEQVRFRARHAAAKAANRSG